MQSTPRLSFTIVNHEFSADGETPMQIVQGLVKRRAEGCVDVAVLRGKTDQTILDERSCAGEQGFGSSSTVCINVNVSDNVPMVHAPSSVVAS